MYSTDCELTWLGQKFKCEVDFTCDADGDYEIKRIYVEMTGDENPLGWFIADESELESAEFDAIDKAVRERIAEIPYEYAE